MDGGTQLGLQPVEHRPEFIDGRLHPGPFTAGRHVFRRTLVVAFLVRLVQAADDDADHQVHHDIGADEQERDHIRHRERADLTQVMQRLVPAFQGEQLEHRQHGFADVVEIARNVGIPMVTKRHPTDHRVQIAQQHGQGRQRQRGSCCPAQPAQQHTRIGHDAQ